jgi:hypothetical protein
MNRGLVLNVSYYLFNSYDFFKKFMFIAEILYIASCLWGQPYAIFARCAVLNPTELDLIYWGVSQSEKMCEKTVFSASVVMSTNYFSPAQAETMGLILHRVSAELTHHKF